MLKRSPHKLTALVLVAATSLVGCAESDPPEPEDPYLWLEEVDGERALAWVREQNAHTAERLKAHPEFDSFYEEALAALDSESRIPSVSQRGDYLYNFWRDDANPRGLYRRTTLDELEKDEPAWETVLDIDALSEAEGEKWVFKGMTCLPKEYRRCLARLSPGGGDASVVREFDMEGLAFVEGGFQLPVAKSQVDWIDEDTLFVGTDFGEGSMTESGYPRLVKVWKRGTPVGEASSIYAGQVESVGAGAERYRSSGAVVDLVFEGTSFWTSVKHHRTEDGLVQLELPDSAVVEGAYGGKLVVSLKDDWTVGGRDLERGSVLIAAPESLHPDGDRNVEILVEPGDGAVVEDVDTTDDAILVTMLENVRGRLYRYETALDGGWARRQIAFPDNGALSVVTTDDATGAFFVEYEDFVTPPTLYHVAGPDWLPRAIKAQEATFDGSGFAVEQHFAESADGTRVPYFQVAAAGVELDGENPTHIFSYGGFRASLTPSYSGSYEALFGAYGKLWLERGGVFVLANIRGGGEFGPDWHAAALLTNRHKAYEDFEAVAEDLIERGVTSPAHLGIEGRSNGGLLVGATMTRRPDLYGAVICGVPLSDMKRYHKLLAGASWVGEYGDPDDPEMWSYIETYSPYHNLKAETDYPATFFFTSTRDDRVHPGHARKMAARMIELGQEVWYYENLEGGHGGSSTNDQLAYRLALAYAHLWSQLS